MACLEAPPRVELCPVSCQPRGLQLPPWRLSLSRSSSSCRYSRFLPPSKCVLCRARVRCRVSFFQNNLGTQRRTCLPSYPTASLLVTVRSRFFFLVALATSLNYLKKASFFGGSKLSGTNPAPWHSNGVFGLSNELVYHFLTPNFFVWFVE
jgi:hypothetical protein